MKNSAILIILVILSGCASVQHVQGTTEEVINTVPSALGTIAAAAVFGGEVNVNPDPVEYIKNDINREGRILYGEARRNTKLFISYSIKKLFKQAK